ncbi:pollen-specific leucine-rich repeat extensin-like protein 4 [Iris pallida]|uniref:Pollen-specific leucine-rich repeat extensin-like protein 4 n=1 Tax=Iris pallida TaxID=29817 RepID=A0AAX6FWA1_IRIPA|nr:pollen-specific leucine-rich repeat extensin-like protein 4 [Iris pallida]
MCHVSVSRSQSPDSVSVSTTTIVQLCLCRHSQYQATIILTTTSPPPATKTTDHRIQNKFCPNLHSPTPQAPTENLIIRRTPTPAPAMPPGAPQHAHAPPPPDITAPMSVEDRSAWTPAVWTASPSSFWIAPSRPTVLGRSTPHPASCAWPPEANEPLLRGAKPHACTAGPSVARAGQYERPLRLPSSAPASW